MITWISAETQRLYDQVIALVRSTSGTLNFHDALIALGCRELGIEIIASFLMTWNSTHIANAELRPCGAGMPEGWVSRACPLHTGRTHGRER